MLLILASPYRRSLRIALSVRRLLDLGHLDAIATSFTLWTLKRSPPSMNHGPQCGLKSFAPLWNFRFHQLRCSGFVGPSRRARRARFPLVSNAPRSRFLVKAWL